VREARTKALAFLEAVSGSLDARAEHEYLERSIRDAIAGVKDGIAQVETQLADLLEDEKTLDGKIKKKQAELARSQKRLDSLQSVRPAFMDEYEKLEHELADEYEGYVTRYRNLQYLEHELDEYNKREKAQVDAANRALRKLQKRLRDEEFRAFRGDEHVGDDEAAAGGGGGGGGRGGAPPRPAAAASAAGGGGAAGYVFIVWDGVGALAITHIHAHTTPTRATHHAGRRHGAALLAVGRCVLARARAWRRAVPQTAAGRQCVDRAPAATMQVTARMQRRQQRRQQQRGMTATTTTWVTTATMTTWATTTWGTTTRTWATTTAATTRMATFRRACARTLY